MTYDVPVSANQTTQSLICEDWVYESVGESMPRRLTLDLYWLIYIRPFLKYGYGSVTNVKVILYSYLILMKMNELIIDS